ncbi:hypothetical protein GCM10023224_06590 [Streptomonospora halophila]|uniref:Uncharacterized protein n=1 Tax=Streptomonospora halophila TaxID=427369 RepID=A0ABP9G5X0_9ACTN
MRSPQPHLRPAPPFLRARPYGPSPDLLGLPDLPGLPAVRLPGPSRPSHPCLRLGRPLGGYWETRGRQAAP